MILNPQTLGLIAGVLGIVQALPYLTSIMRGKTRPNRASYAIWSLVNCVTISSYIVGGARTTIWFGLATTLTGLTIFVLSIRRGMGGHTPFDITCLVLSASSVLLWVATGSAAVALYVGVTTSMLGYLPTILKARRLPATENLPSWAMTFMAGLLNLAALTSLSPHVLVLPMESSIGSGLTLSFLIRHAVRHRGNPAA